MALSLNCKGEHNPIYRENSISQSQQGKDRSVVCARREISRLLLLCDERQMPTHGASQVQSKDEIKTERTDGENGAFPPTRDGCIHSLSMRERG